MDSFYVPKVGESITVDLAHKTTWDANQYPFTATLIEQSVIDNDTDREYKLLNHRTGGMVEVEKNWFNTMLTGRIIKKV